MLTIYDSPLAVIMPHTYLNHNWIFKKKHDVEHYQVDSIFI